jgi:transcriptional regulator with XRE-family HTH domain
VKDLLILLGRRVHDLRAVKGWSQEEFAHVSGLHRTYIGQVERGEKNISFENLSKISAVLGVTLSGLLKGLEGGNIADKTHARAELRPQRIKNEAHQVLEYRRLLKRMRLQHKELGRTIMALESLGAEDRRRPQLSRPRKSG